MDNVRPADAYWGHQDQILAQRQKIKSHRRPGINDVATAAKRPTAVVIFFSESKADKSLSYLFSAAADRPHLSIWADDVQFANVKKALERGLSMVETVSLTGVSISSVKRSEKQLEKASM